MGFHPAPVYFPPQGIPYSEVMAVIGRIALARTRRVGWAREMIFDLPFFRVDLPPNPRPGHLRKAGRLLRAHGVRKAVAPPDFGAWDLLARYGVGPVEPGEFCRDCAAVLALALLPDPASARVALRGDRVTRSLRMAALALCPQVREVVIVAPVGGDALRKELRREFGLPILEDLAARPPDLAVHFAPVMGMGGERVLDLAGPWPRPEGWRLSPIQGPLPEGTDRLPLMAALWENGRLLTGQVAVFVPPAGGGLRRDFRMESGSRGLTDRNKLHIIRIIHTDLP